MFILDLSTVFHTQDTKDAERGLFFKTVFVCAILLGQILTPGANQDPLLALTSIFRQSYHEFWGEATDGPNEKSSDDEDCVF